MSLPRSERDDATVASAIAAITAHHAVAPWMLGATSLQLARQLGCAESVLVATMERAIRVGAAVYDRGYYAAPNFHAQLTPEQRVFFDAALAHDGDKHTVTPHVFATLLAAMRQSTVPGLMTAFDMLVATGAIVRVREHLYDAEQFARVRASLERVLHENGPITAGAARDAIGLSRKFVVPLLEYFDAIGVTVREGDCRRLRDTV